MENTELSKASTKDLERTLYFVATALCAARGIISKSIAHSDLEILGGVEALVEKAGCLTDHALEQITGSTQVVGGYVDWCRLAQANRDARAADGNNT